MDSPSLVAFFHGGAIPIQFGTMGKNFDECLACLEQWGYDRPLAVVFPLPGVGFPTIGPGERLSARLDGLGQFLVLRYLTPLWTESKLTRSLLAM